MLGYFTGLEWTLDLYESVTIYAGDTSQFLLDFKRKRAGGSVSCGRDIHVSRWECFSCSVVKGLVPGMERMETARYDH